MSTSEEIERVWTTFYVQYGSAMLAWAIIESELATLFSFLTGIPPDMATRIFYSARSFRGRTDIFKSSLTACKISEELKTFTRALIRKADQYGDSRNKFAHDLPLFAQPTPLPDTWHILMVDGKSQFQSDDVKKAYVAEAITADDIADIIIHFRALGEIIRDYWIAFRPRKEPSLDEASLGRLRGRLAALPTLPRPKARSQPPAKPARRPRPSRR